MQDLAWVRRFCAQNPKNALFFIFDKPRIPYFPRIGTSHGGLSNFRSGAAKNNLPPTRIGTSYGGLSNFRSGAVKNNLPPPDWNFLWRT